MLEPLGLHAAIDLFLLGAIVYLMVYELWIWGGERGERGYLISAIWCLVSAIFLVGRMIQFTTRAAEIADLVVKLQVAAAIPLVALALGRARIIAGRHSQTWNVTLILAALAAVPVTFTTELFVAKEIEWVSGLLGHRFLMNQPGPLVPAAFALTLLTAAYIVAIMARAKGVAPAGQRRAWMLLAPIAALAAANDLLLFARWVDSIHCFELLMVGVSVVLSYFEVRRHDAVHSSLEQRVAQRTEQLQRAVSQALASEARFRLLAQATREGVIIHEQGRILDVNNPLLEMFGCDDAAALKGKEVLSLLDEVSHEAAAAVLATTQLRTVELVGRRLDSGARFPLEAAGRESRQAKPAAVLALRDLTEHKKLQAHLLQTERLASMGTIAAGMAHEINNPLSYTAMNLQLIEEALAAEGPLDAHASRELRELARTASDGCQRVDRIVRELKSFARKDDQALGPVDLRAVFEATIRIAANEIRHRARLVREFASAPPVLGDDGRLSQVLLNLLINAAQALPEGQASQHKVKAVIRWDGQKTVVAEVSDSGAGIAEPDLQRIFDPFFSSKAGGLGLGLPICKNIVEALGGQISVRSTPGQGTTFRLELPVADEQKLPAAIVSAVSFDDDVPPGRARVLVIDDELFVRRALDRALSDACEVVLAGSGDKALRLCAEQQFDVVFCDLMMPDLTGMEIYDALRARSPQTAERIVFLTGGAFTDRAQAFLEAVPNPRLDKPVDITTLRQMVRQVLAKAARATPPPTASNTKTTPDAN